MGCAVSMLPWGVGVAGPRGGEAHDPFIQKGKVAGVFSGVATWEIRFVCKKPVG